MDSKNQKHKKYDDEFRLMVLRDYYEHGMSQNAVVHKYGLSCNSLIMQWKEMFPIDSKLLSLSDIAIENIKSLKPIVDGKIDVAFICGTDFGTQDSQFCSSDTFRDLYLPYYKKINDYIHSNTKWKTFKHSCGAVEPLVQDLIDAGFDILNPVQINAVGMDSKKLKAKYGKYITFWGGGVDTQKMLSFGKPADVEKQVMEQCEILSKDGGFVFNSVHNVQANTPTANLVAMINAVKKFNGEK